jgi:abortive infection bacteriophage resistance protein
MSKPYAKPVLSFEQQVAKLVARGLVISDPTAAASKLACISYYRLSGYCYPFRQRGANGQVLDTLVAGTTWEQILGLYEFDRHLRLLVLDAIERVEVAVRTQLTYHLADTYGAFGHTAAANFHSKFEHAKWLAQIEIETQRSNDEFIQHYQREYDGFPTIPLWMLTEVMSLGNLSRLYQGLQPNDKRPIASHFNLHHKRLVDWLHTLTYVRNVCAHHSRLWNRELAIRPDKVKDSNWLPPITPRNDRMFYVLLILRHLLAATGNGTDWANEVNQLLAPFAENRQWRAAMGVPDQWEHHPVWANL